jgi:hypothetical protein
MTAFTGAWDRAGVATFLDDAVIPIRVATTTPSGHLWMVSLWFRRRAIDGGGGGAGSEGAHREDADRIECATAASADLVGYLDADPGVAFEVSTNEVPYRGVRGRGTATVEPDPEKAVLRALIERYLGGTDSRLARTLLREERDEVRIRIDPAKVYSWDFSDRMGGADGSDRG